MSSSHMHRWHEECHVGTRTCLECGIAVTFDHREDAVASINDWASKCAERIMLESFVHVGRTVASRDAVQDRIAAIIATFAGPLMEALRDSRLEHHHYDGDVRDGHCCPQCCCESWPDDPEGDFEPEPNKNEPCDCGADEHNARIDRALSGGKR